MAILSAVFPVEIPSPSKPFETKSQYEIPISTILYPPLEVEQIVATYPVSPDKQISGGNGFALRTFFTDSTLPKHDFESPVWPIKVSNGFRQSHPAADLTGSYKSPLYSMDSGVVEKAVKNGQYNGGFGNYVIVDFGGGWKALYAHMAEVFVKEGEQVERKQIIGTMGNTGRVYPAPTASRPLNGVHLHIELQLFGEYVNILRYIL